MPRRDIPCGPELVCGTSCCVTSGPSEFACNLETCTGAQYLCDGEEDCELGQDCCTDGSDTFCQAAGTCPQEVCHDVSTCTAFDDDDTECVLRGGPFPVCIEDD